MGGLWSAGFGRERVRAISKVVPEGLVYLARKVEGSIQSHLQALIIYKLGFTQNYHTFTFTLLLNVVLCDGEIP